MNTTKAMAGRWFHLYLASLEHQSGKEQTPRTYQTFIVSGATDDPEIVQRTTTDLRFKRTFDEVSSTYQYNPKWYFHTGRSPPTVTARMYLGSVRGSKFAALIRFIMAPNHVEHVVQATPPEQQATWDNIRWVNIVLTRLMRTTLVQAEGDYDVPEVVPVFEEFLYAVAEDMHEPGEDGLPPTICCPLKPCGLIPHVETGDPTILSNFSQSM